MSTALNGISEIVSREYPALEGDDRRELIDKMMKEKIQETTEFLVDAFNTMGYEEDVRKAMLAGINRSHRYIQQEFWSGMFKNIKEYGETNPNRYDARNEWAVRTCKEMSKVLY